MSIRILDKDLNLLGDVDDFTSMRWIRNWSKSDKFTITADASIKNINNLISDLGYNIIIFKDRQGIITDYKVLEEDVGTLNITGRSLSFLADRRITMPPKGKAYDTYNTNVETIMKSLVEKNMSSPADPKRKIPRIRIAKNRNRGPRILFQTRYKNLEEELAKLSELSGLGWKIYLDYDAKDFIFEVYEGTDYSGADPKQNPIIFGPDFDNLIKQEKTFMTSDYRNMAIVGGQGEGADRDIISIGDNEEGIDRREVFIDARDIESELGTEALVSRGKERLKDLSIIDSFETAIDPYKNFIYGEDWNVGDIVLIRPDLVNTQEPKRIISVEEAYEGFGLEDIIVTSGTSLPSLSETINNLNKKVSSEVIGGSGSIIESPEIPEIDIDTNVYFENNIEDSKIPSDFKDGVTISNISQSGKFPFGWGGLVTFKPYDSYRSLQLFISSKGEFRARRASGNTNWDNWTDYNDMIDDNNNSPQEVDNSLAITHTLISSTSNSYDSYDLLNLPGYKVKEVRPLYMIRKNNEEQVDTSSNYYSYYDADLDKIVGSTFLFDTVEVYSKYTSIRLYNVKQANIMIIYEKE